MNAGRDGAMLWIRGIVFTALVPGAIGVLVPLLLSRPARLAGGLSVMGWIPVVTGAAIYALCLAHFLASGGTPAIFFARGVRLLIGEEPRTLVDSRLYRLSRNPMYVGVLLVVFGQAVLLASATVAIYGVVLWLFFHLAVVLLEEPHLRRVRGASYDEYCRRVPRWFAWR